MLLHPCPEVNTDHATCQTCDVNFNSRLRYAFHMQFHAEEMMVRSSYSSQMHQAWRPKLKKAFINRFDGCFPDPGVWCVRPRFRHGRRAVRPRDPGSSRGQSFLRRMRDEIPSRTRLGAARLAAHPGPVQSVHLSGLRTSLPRHAHLPGAHGDAHGGTSSFPPNFKPSRVISNLQLKGCKAWYRLLVHGNKRH